MQKIKDLIAKIQLFIAGLIAKVKGLFTKKPVVVSTPVDIAPIVSAPTAPTSVAPSAPTAIPPIDTAIKGPSVTDLLFPRDQRPDAPVSQAVAGPGPSERPPYPFYFEADLPSNQDITLRSIASLDFTPGIYTLEVAEGIDQGYATVSINGVVTGGQVNTQLDTIPTIVVSTRPGNPFGGGLTRVFVHLRKV